MESRVGNKYNQYRLGRKIGIGEIYHGTNIQTNEEVAIKLENVKTKHPQLLYEAKLYRILQGGKGIPNVKWYSADGEHNVLAVELLGPTLVDRLEICGGTFSLKTVLLLADQMIECIDFVQSKSILHRDIRPDNFVMGLGEKDKQVYIMDFGLAKKYLDPTTHKHIPMDIDLSKKLTGTARYASRFTHLGYEQSRRDDLESLGYVLMYFLRGRLPWDELKGKTTKKRSDELRKMKITLPIEALCRGFPAEFQVYFHICRSLGFTDEPNYTYLRRMFRDLFDHIGFKRDSLFDWTIVEYQQSKLATPPPRPLAREITELMKAANISIESYLAGLFAKLLEKKNVEDLILNVGAGGGGAAVSAVAAPGAAAPAAEEKKEEKKEEAKEESDDDMGFSLFD